MNNRIAQFWADVRARREELTSQFPDGEVWLASLDNHELGVNAGAVTCASIEIAAECLVKRTHRLAMPEEIEGYKRNDRERGAAIRDDERARGR